MTTTETRRDQAHPKVGTNFDRRGWFLVGTAALALAVVSWVTNVTTMAQISGEANEFLTFRNTLSKLANSGTAWAGLAILCGWSVRRPISAAMAGVAGSWLALAAHYAIGRISGMFAADIWTENVEWFMAAVLFGGPLGLVGAAARRGDVWGFIARLVVPVGAVLEPFVIGMFTSSPMRSWPDRFASVVCGIILIAGGVVCGVAFVITNAVGRRRADHYGT